MPWWHWVLGLVEFCVTAVWVDWFTYGRHQPKPEPEPVMVYHRTLPPEPVAGERVQIAPGVYEDRIRYRASSVYDQVTDMAKIMERRYADNDVFAWGGELVRSVGPYKVLHPQQAVAQEYGIGETPDATTI